MPDHPLKLVRLASGLTREDFAHACGLETAARLRNLEQDIVAVSREVSGQVGAFAGALPHTLESVSSTPLGFDGIPYTEETFSAWRDLVDRRRNRLIDQRDADIAGPLAGRMISALAHVYFGACTASRGGEFLLRLQDFLDRERRDLCSQVPGASESLDTSIQEHQKVAITFGTDGLPKYTYVAPAFSEDDWTLSRILSDRAIAQSLARDGKLEGIMEQSKSEDAFRVSYWNVTPGWRSILRKDALQGVVASAPSGNDLVKIYRVIPMSKAKGEDDSIARDTNVTGGDVMNYPGNE